LKKHYGKPKIKTSSNLVQHHVASKNSKYISRNLIILQNPLGNSGVIWVIEKSIGKRNSGGFYFYFFWRDLSIKWIYSRSSAGFRLVLEYYSEDTSFGFLPTLEDYFEETVVAVPKSSSNP